MDKIEKKWTELKKWAELKKMDIIEKIDTIKMKRRFHKNLI